MRNAYIFEGVAVLVGPWHEPMTPPERGTRVEVRLLEREPERGSRFAAERVVLDRPVFRADLFDRTTSAPGNLESAHFHPRFDGIEPCDRHWDEAIKRDATAWLAGELADLRVLLARSGVDVGDAAWLDDDADALRAAVPDIVAAVESTWAKVRAD